MRGRVDRMCLSRPSGAGALNWICALWRGLAMTAKDVTAPDDEDRLTEQQRPPPEERPEPSRIAALLRDRFGIEH